METEHGKLPPPPGLIASLARGFDSVANHILVILPPLLFDLFLWLGPRLSLETLRPRMLSMVSATLRGAPASQAIPIHTQVNDFLQGFNLFSALRTFPVGTFSLLSYQIPTQTPLGTPASLDAGPFFSILGWALVLVFLGWVVGALYFYWVCGVTLQPEARSLWKALRQAVLLSAVWLVMLAILGMPISVMLTMLMVISPAMAQVMLFVGTMLLIWLAVPVFFSAHGVFAFQQDAFRAILNSLRMTRFTLPTTSLFLLAFVVINGGLNFLWNTPPQDSWWTLVGIGGHAFVSTALLAASFIYYRDVNVWLKTVFEQLQRQTLSAKS